MSEMPPGFRIYLANASKLSGKTEAEMLAVMSKSGLKKHGDLRQHAMAMLGIGHGHANALAAYYLRPDWQPKPPKAAAPKPAPAKPVAAAKPAPPKPVAKVEAKKAPAKAAPVKKPVAKKAVAKKAAPKKKK